MTEDPISNLPDDIINFEVPTVPQIYDFGRPETPEEIAARESFFTSGASRVYSYPQRQSGTESVVSNNENAQPGGNQPEFKRPVNPAPRPATSTNTAAAASSTSVSSTETAVEQQIEAPNLAELAAFRGPRKPLRRSQLNTAASVGQGSAGSSSQSQSVSKPLSAASAAERRRSASATKNAPNNVPEQRRRSGSTDRAARAASTTTAPSQRVLPAIPRIRGSSLTRPGARPVSTSSNTSGGGGVQTRAMAAAAAATTPDADASVAAVTAGVARMNVARAGTPTDRRPAAAAANDRNSRPTARGPSAPAPMPAAPEVRVAGASRPAGGAAPIRVGASRPAGGVAPIRVGAPLRAADRFLAETAAASNNSARAETSTAVASAVPSVRPNSALRKPTQGSIQRLAAPRLRQTPGVASTPKRFSTALRTYPRDDSKAGTVTIPDTPRFRVDRRASSNTRAPPASAVDTAAVPAQSPTNSASRPPINLSRLVNRLSQPRPQRVAAAADATATGTANTSLPPNPRRIGAVPVGRTHGLPVIRRTTTNTATAIRSRSNSAVRAAAAAGGVVQGASVPSASETTEQQQQ